MDAAKATEFPGLKHPARELYAHMQTVNENVFILFLNNRKTIRFVTAQVAEFKQWLDENEIKDVLQVQDRKPFFKQ